MRCSPRDLAQTLTTLRAAAPLEVPAPPADDPDDAAVADLEAGEEPRDDELDVAPAAVRAPPGARTVERAALERLVYFALRRVAARLEVDELPPHRYQAGRDELLDRQRDLADMLPTVGQIEALMTWEEALAVAELAGATPGDWTDQRVHQPGLDPAQATAEFVRLNDAWPTLRVLQRFAAAAGFALADIRVIGPTREGARKILEAEGRTAPPEDRIIARYGKGIRVPTTLPEGATPSRGKRGDRAAYIHGLKVWLAQLEPGDRRSQKAYLAFSVGHADCPAPSAFLRHGGFTKLRDEAEKELATG